VRVPAVVSDKRGEVTREDRTSASANASQIGVVATNDYTRE
jgi:hypothetical protein